MEINALRKFHNVQAIKQVWVVWMVVIGFVFGIQVYVGYLYVKMLLQFSIPLNYAKTTPHRNCVQLMVMDALH